ncbi:MAG: hypothetical protein MJ232_03235 [archaeon]|nr:hypothetical protein [archaeon]
MEVLNITHHILDLLLKKYGEKFINILLNEINCKEKITKTLPTELIEDCQNLRADFVGLTKSNKILNIEFQSTKITPKDKARFTKYDVLLIEKYHKEVITIIISTHETKNKEILFKLHKGSNHMYLVVLKNINGDKIYENIIKKHKNNTKLNKKDIADLSLLPLFYSKNKKETVIYNITKILPNLNLDKDDLTYLKFNLNLYIEKFVKDRKILKKINGELNMMEHLEDMIIDIEKRLLAESEENGIEKGIKIGKEDGIKIGEEKLMIKFVESMIKDNYSKKEILKITKINENQYNKIQKNLSK